MMTLGSVMEEAWSRHLENIGLLLNCIDTCTRIMNKRLRIVNKQIISKCELESLCRPLSSSRRADTEEHRLKSSL
jgi:hypothetical protein